MRPLKFFSFVLSVIILSVVSANIISAQDNNTGKITAAAVWQPNMDVMNEIASNCGSYQGKDLEQCFLSVMQKSGASKQAIAFTESIGNNGYMNRFKELKTVDAAFVYYPLKQTDHKGCMLVNGSPGFIDVDDYNLLDMSDMEKSPAYAALAKSFEEISLWPGDREGTEYPYAKSLPKKSVRIIVNYSLRNGCNTCNLIAFVEFGFDFDSTGVFLGTKFLSIKKSVIAADETSTNITFNNVYVDPSNPINLKVGDKFAIVLPSNHSMGFSWQLAKPLKGDILSMLGTDFIIPNETLPNAAGKETWSFKAVGKGSTDIYLKYVRSWGEADSTFEKETYKVNVN